MACIVPAHALGSRVRCPTLQLMAGQVCSLSRHLLLPTTEALPQSRGSTTALGPAALSEIMCPGPTCVS